MHKIADREREPRIIWVYAGQLNRTLDSATWIEASRELRKNHIDITLVFEGTADPEQFQGVTVIPIPERGAYFFGSLFFHLKLIRYLLQEWSKVDLILFHQRSAPWLIPLCLLPRRRRGGRPLLVMDTRDLNVSERGLKSWLRVLFFNLAHFLTNKWADGQLAITQKMADLVGIPPSQLLGLWPSGVKLGRFKRAMIGRRWPEGAETIHLMYLGKLHAERNLLALCDAVQTANGKGMNFRLSFVGAGPGKTELEEFIHNTDSPIFILSPVPHTQIPAMLNQAHIGVTSLPAPDDRKYAASSPIKLFEYMAAGLPILATRNPCHSDVLGESWFTFWAEDASSTALILALEHIWQKRGSLRSLGMLSTRTARKWTWEEAGRKLAAALQSGLEAGLEYDLTNPQPEVVREQCDLR